MVVGTRQPNIASKFSTEPELGHRVVGSAPPKDQRTRRLEPIGLNGKEFRMFDGSEMSVVGPRPQVLREVESYDDLMRRRLMVRPGVTGLWQVSGRSDLPLDDAIRLDLSYVENWTMAQDVVIIARTLRAVMASQGAY